MGVSNARALRACSIRVIFCKNLEVGQIESLVEILLPATDRFDDPLSILGNDRLIWEAGLGRLSKSDIARLQL
jgi:hypothetical protein